MAAAFQDHHIIPQDFADNPVIEFLTENGLYDVQASGNRIFLLASTTLAGTLGTSPHNGGPLDSYQQSVTTYLVAGQVAADTTGQFIGTVEPL
ncbi:hypothetical protein PQR14_17505 [Paraburkholderia bryophila]|uniref:hypothetical protein n=1 Tax=Burkholderiaceae TaxID=119060 RepID=UPI0012E0163E|nr:hypothetical protein [Burkholderia sp. 9120]